MAQPIQIRGGTAAEWTAANPVLAHREMGVETDTLQHKFGDGATNWTHLPYAAAGSGPPADGTITAAKLSTDLNQTIAAKANASALVNLAPLNSPNFTGTIFVNGAPLAAGTGPSNVDGGNAASTYTAAAIDGGTA